MSIQIESQMDSALAQNIKIIAKLFSDTHLREDFLNSIVQKVQAWTDCQCVGIRVISRDEFMPYEAYSGFSRDFWLHENWLSLKDHQCGCVRVATGTPDPLDEAILTEGGTLYTNDLQEFGRTLPEALYDRYRGKCIECGFASLAVLPIRHKSRILGLIHLADKRKDMLPPEKIHILESVAPAIGEVIIRFSTEAALERKEKFSSQLIESMFDGFAVFSVRGSILNVNEALCKMTGFSRNELVGSCPPYPFSPKEYLNTMKGNFLKLREGESLPIETEFLHKRGDRFPVVLSPSSLLDAEGNIQCYLATVKDMSSLEKTRSELVQKVVELSAAFEKIRHLDSPRLYL